MQLAFKNTPTTQEQALAEAKAHREADQFIQGTWWEDGKGCSLGCQFHSRKKATESYFEAAHRETGMPLDVCYMQERIFEGLPNNKAVFWNERVYSAIKPGADLSMVIPKLMLWMLVDKENGVVKYTKSGSLQEKAVLDVATLYERKIAGHNPSVSEWKAAVWAAAKPAAKAAAGAAAAKAAAGAAAWAAEAEAAAEAAWAAEVAGASSRASWAEAEAEAWAALAASFYEKLADKFISLLTEASEDIKEAKGS